MALLSELPGCEISADTTELLRAIDGAKKAIKKAAAKTAVKAVVVNTKSAAAWITVTNSKGEKRD